jgi:nitroreductase
MIILARKALGVKYDSSYIQHMLRDVKQMPEDVIGMINQFYEKFQKEDFKLLESDRTLFDWASKQTYLALANMMTGAATKGIDSCPMEGFDVAMSEEFLKNELDIDTEAFGVSVMVAFGYRKSEPRAKSRQNIEDITAWYC